MNHPTYPTYKVVIVGDGGSGKTTLCRWVMEGVFLNRYVATLGVEVHPLTFETNYGPIQLNCWDTAGQEKFGGLREGYYYQADAAILMFDATSKITYRGIAKRWHPSVKRVCGDIPMVMAGNKTDLVKDRKVHIDAEGVAKLEAQGVSYFDISMRNGVGVDEMFTSLIRKLTNLRDLVIL